MSHRVPLGQQAAHRPREIDEVLDGNSVGQQVVVLQPLLLLVRMNFQQQAFATKEEPLGKAVVRLDLVRASRNLLAQLRAAQVLQQERGPNDAAEFSEGLIEVIASAVGAQLPQEQRRRHDTSFH
jgi:hypothetical protein